MQLRDAANGAAAASGTRPAAGSGVPSEAPGGAAAVDRALLILAAYGTEDDALTLAGIAARTGLYKSTLLRLIQSLLHARLLLRLEDGRYRIGPEALRLGALYQRAHNVGDVVLPAMRALMEATGESVVFHVREGRARVALHRVESRHMVRYNVREGDILPLDAGSGGRVLLAFGGARGEPYETIRERMFHGAHRERDPDTSGLSAPVFGPRQLLAGAVTVAGPASRVTEAFVAQHAPALLEAVARMTRNLGGDASVFVLALHRLDGMRA